MNNFKLWLHTRNGRITLIIVSLALVAAIVVLGMYTGILPTPGAAGRCWCGGRWPSCTPCRN